MNSEVIKYVAGGGKTTTSLNILKEKKNGLYLAYTTSVVNDIYERGFISKTIDSLFSSYIIPKFISMIPIIGGPEIQFFDSKDADNYLKGIGAIHIDTNGKIYYKRGNRKYNTVFNINILNENLEKLNNQPYYSTVSKIFNRKTTLMTHTLRNELSRYLIQQYPGEIIKILNDRFEYIIIDEAQDLSDYKEDFAKLLYNSEIKSYFFGDCNQNIINNGKWFEDVESTQNEYKSYRCPETNCKWIRDNLHIEIHGNSSSSEICKIKYSEVLKYDDGKNYLLYTARRGKDKEIVDRWTGKKDTIQSAKGSTIEESIVIIGKTLNKKRFYTAITRTRKNVYYTIEN